MTRLANIAPERWQEIKDLPEHLRRAVVLSACKYAIDESGTNEPLILNSYKTLSLGSELSQTQIFELKEMAEELDEQYLMTVKDDDSEEDEGEDLAKVARTAAAISFAAEFQSVEAAAEALYEASCVTYDDATFWNLLTSIITINE